MPKGRTRPERTLPFLVGPQKKNYISRPPQGRTLCICASLRARSTRPPSVFDRVCSLRFIPQHRRPTSHTRGRALRAVEKKTTLLTRWPDPFGAAKLHTNCASRSLATECRLLHQATRAKAPPHIEDPSVVAGGSRRDQKLRPTHTYGPRASRFRK